MNRKNAYINFAIIMSLIMALLIAGFAAFRAYVLKGIIEIADNEPFFLRSMYQDQINTIVACVLIIIFQFAIFYLSRKKIKELS